MFYVWFFDLKACGILASWPEIETYTPGIEPTLLELKGDVLRTDTNSIL